MKRSNSLTRTASINSSASKRSKTSSRKRISSVPRNRVSVGRQALPPQLFNTVRYAEVVAKILSGGFTYHQWSCNGLYDPNITGTGHQPMYFDQLIGLYDHYTVLRSRFKIQVSCPTANIGINWGVYLEDDTGATLSGTYVYEHGGVSTMEITQASNPKTLYSKWSSARTFGPGTQSDPTMQGDAANNPTEQSLYTVVVNDITASSSDTIYLSVQIEYDVVWDELTTVSQS